jgi:hypothetical protein
MKTLVGHSAPGHTSEEDVTRSSYLGVSVVEYVFSKTNKLVMTAILLISITAETFHDIIPN